MWLVFWSVAGFVANQRGAPRTALALWGAAATLGGAGMFRPSSMRLVYALWMGAAYPIGLLVSNVALAAVFYLVFTPLGLLQRLAGRDPLARRLDRTMKSYWEPRAGTPSASKYFKQY